MNKCSAAAVLTESKLFSGISEDDVNHMMDCSQARVMNYSAGEVICRFDSDSGKVGVMVKGEAELLRIDYAGNRTVLEILAKGDVFGQTLAFSNLTGDALDVVCKKSATVVFIPADFVSGRCSNACVRHSVFVRNMLTIISDKTQALSERIEVLSNRSIRDKLMCYFSIHCAKNRSNCFVMPFSLSTLSDYICCDRSAMMRELGQMKDEGIVSVNKGEVTLL